MVGGLDLDEVEFVFVTLYHHFEDGDQAHKVLIIIRIFQLNFLHLLDRRLVLEISSICQLVLDLLKNNLKLLLAAQLLIKTVLCSCIIQSINCNPPLTFSLIRISMQERTLLLVVCWLLHNLLVVLIVHYLLIVIWVNTRLLFRSQIFWWWLIIVLPLRRVRVLDVEETTSYFINKVNIRLVFLLVVLILLRIL